MILEGFSIAYMIYWSSDYYGKKRVVSYIKASRNGIVTSMMISKKGLRLIGDKKTNICSIVLMGDAFSSELLDRNDSDSYLCKFRIPTDCKVIGGEDVLKWEDIRVSGTDFPTNSGKICVGLYLYKWLAPKDGNVSKGDIVGLYTAYEYLNLVKELEKKIK